MAEAPSKSQCERNDATKRLDEGFANFSKGAAFIRDTGLT